MCHSVLGIVDRPELVSSGGDEYRAGAPAVVVVAAHGGAGPKLGVTTRRKGGGDPAGQVCEGPCALLYSDLSSKSRKARLSTARRPASATRGMPASL